MLKLRAAVVLVAALAAAAGTARLGLWQLDRAAQKVDVHEAQLRQRALPPLRTSELPHDATAVPAQVYRSVVLQGVWLAAHTVYLENRQMNGRPGFYAVTPLRLDDGSAVLVERGWVPRDLMDRLRVAAPAPPTGVVQVQGRIAPGPGRLYEFEGAASGPIRQNLGVAAYARETGLPLRPFSVVQEDGISAPADGLLRQWPAPAADVQKHYGYAFQWFALCALIIGLYVWFQLLRPSRTGAGRA
ncbi:MAG: SURF1 family protein [Hylemonella sp.]|nr:SURF1 family protein [Hylemonella sp.]